LTTDSVTDLRQRVARGDYVVDAGRVADSVVSKIKLIKLARRSLEDGRSPQRAARPH
jgi:hypothetical protein